MNFKQLLIILLVLFTRVLYAQTDFKPGYILKLNCDTVYGEIDYRGDLLMSEKCKFRLIGQKIDSIYGPTDILAYRFIDGKYFISKEVNGENVFLEFLIKGRINIYYARDEAGDHYYIEKEGSKLSALPFYEGIKYKDDVPHFYQSTTHIGTLKVYMQDAPDFQKQINKITKPEHDNLVKLAENYHNLVCKDEKCIIFEKRVPLIKLAIEPFWGKIKYNGDEYYFGNFDLINEFGLLFYLWIPRDNEKLHLKTGIAYQKIPEGEEFVNLYRIPMQIQYFYPSNKLRPDVSLGINVLTVKEGVGHTICLNAGIIYKVYEGFNMCLRANSDYTPLFKTYHDKSKFQLISYSINLGLYIEL